MSLWQAKTLPSGPLLSNHMPPLALTWQRYPGDDPPDVILPASAAGGGGGLVVSTARSFGFVLGCLFMALLALA